MDDRTPATAMIAVQGPWAVPRMDSLTSGCLSALRYYHAGSGRVGGRAAIISRTGYTGEDGCELIVAAEDADPVWEACQAATSGEPAGLGARDTLRLEAAMPLYGHELNESINPFQADLAFAVNLEDRDFLGRTALLQLRDNTALPRRVGLAMEGKRAAREHYPILAAGTQIGEICSGSLSPTLGYPIAMAYLPAEYQQPSRTVDVDIRGTMVPARIVPLPFYKRKKT
jgi:aminomethyltransferase